jgi:hypothetical protein
VVIAAKCRVTMEQKIADAAGLTSHERADQLTRMALAMREIAETEDRAKVLFRRSHLRVVRLHAGSR